MVPVGLGRTWQSMMESMMLVWLATYTCPLRCVGLGPWYLITPVH